MRWLFLLVLLGCSGVGQETPGEDCVHLGDRCSLREGLLGICAETTEPCETPPCMRCTPQH